MQKICIERSKEVAREKDACQAFLEKHNAEIEPCLIIKLLYMSAKLKLAQKNFHVAWILLTKA